MFIECPNANQCVPLPTHHLYHSNTKPAVYNHSPSCKTQAVGTFDPLMHDKTKQL